LRGGKDLITPYYTAAHTTPHTTLQLNKNREPVVQRKGPYYTSSHTTPHTTLRLNQNREALRQRKLRHRGARRALNRPKWRFPARGRRRRTFSVRLRLCALIYTEVCMGGCMREHI
jgi:hypothetical protein